MSRSRPSSSSTRLAETAGISVRFVGSEPFCPVTRAYNEALAQALPARGVALRELPRLERDGRAVSATAVRALVRVGRWEEIRPLVPETTSGGLDTVAVRMPSDPVARAVIREAGVPLL